MAPARFLYSTCLLLICSSWACATSEPAKTSLRAFVEAGAQVHSQGAGPTTQLSLRYRPTAHLYVDVVGRSGAIIEARDRSDQFYVAMLVGPGLSSGEDFDGWEWRLSPRLSHVHHASWASWGHTPGHNIGGDSAGGVVHRSGFELSAGLSGPQFGEVLGQRILWNVELIGNALPSSATMAWGAGMLMGFSLRDAQ